MAEQTILLPQTLTAPLLCVLESSLPRAKSRTQRPSPWCQLPASVFPAAPGSGSYICPEADGAALQGSGASSGGPRAPHLKRSSGLPPPARGRSFAAACLSPSVCPLLPDPLPVALGIGVQQGPKERKKCPGPGTDPQGALRRGIATSYSGNCWIGKNSFMWVLVEELRDPDFPEPQAQRARHLCISGCWIGEGVWGKLGLGLVVPR